MPRHGENIRKRSDGRWEARLIFTSRPDEKKIIKSFYGSTYAEAKMRRADFLNNLNKAESRLPVGCSSPAFREVASAWMSAKALSVKTSTLSIYSCELNMYILPAFGDCPIGSLNGDCIDDFLTNLLQNGRKPDKFSSPVLKAENNTSTEELKDRALSKGKSVNGKDDMTNGNMAGNSMVEKAPSADVIAEDGISNTKRTGLSGKTVSNIKMVLMSILRYARKRHIIETVPECMKISCVVPQIEVLTVVEQRALEEVLFSVDKPICLISILSLYTGIRIGEACGLQWKDVDLVNGTISITKTVLRITNIDASQTKKTKIVIQSPKTQASIRVIPIPDQIMGYLQQHKSEDNIYLASNRTTFTEPRQHQYQFKQILNQAGIPYHKFHVLRHTFATRCIEQGVDVKSLSEILGHSSVTITMQRYVHPSLEMKRAQINKLTQI